MRSAKVRSEKTVTAIPAKVTPAAGSARIELPIRQWAARFGQWEANQVRPRVAPKRIWLRRPVHIALRRSVAVEMVLGAILVGDDLLLGRGRSRKEARSFQRSWLPR
jgi:hypothetical protein